MLAKDQEPKTTAKQENDAADLQRMRRLRLGDGDALAELMRGYWTPLVRYAARLMGTAEGAEDVVQETFVVLWKERAEWDGSGSPRALLYGITRRLVLKERRHRSVRERWVERIRRGFRSVPTPFEATHQSELRDALQAAIDALPPRRREAFVLSRYHDLSLREVAEIMQISPQTVANQVSAAVAELRRSLEKFNG